MDKTKKTKKKAQSSWLYGKYPSIPPEIIDEEAGPDKVIEALHDRTGEKHHELPLLDEDHLAFDVKCLVDILIQN